VADIRRQLITDAVVARVAALGSWLTVYRAEIRNPDGSTHLATLPNDDRVSSYVVAYPYAGSPTGERDLGDTLVDLDYGIQLTCVAGYAADCEYLVDQVHPQMYLWTPTVTGLVFGRFRPPPGFDPGPVRRDPDVTPPRFSVPLQYRIPVTT
jgi:hypothetical protein